MATRLPFTGTFRVTNLYGTKNSAYALGWHTGIDLVGNDERVYSICQGTVNYAGWENASNPKQGFGQYVSILFDQNANGYKKVFLAHLSSISVKVGQSVTHTTVVGNMGSTGFSTGKHTHVEIREYDKNGTVIRRLNPANYMGIPNAIGSYNSQDYAIDTPSNAIEFRTLARNTNLRSAPGTSSSKVLYLANTTLNVLEKSVAVKDGYTWDKVQIRVNGKTGYMINQNYK